MKIMVPLYLIAAVIFYYFAYTSCSAEEHTANFCWRWSLFGAASFPFVGLIFVSIIGGLIATHKK